MVHRQVRKSASLDISEGYSRRKETQDEYTIGLQDSSVVVGSTDHIELSQDTWTDFNASRRNPYSV